MLYSKTLLFIHSVYNILHLLTPNSQSTLPSPPPSPLVTSSFFMFVSLFYHFSHSVMPDSLQPHELQHTRPPCSSPTLGACLNSCTTSWWCHPTISSSVVPFSLCLQSFPALGSFPMSQFFASGGQSIGASASVLPVNNQDWSPLGWTGWISLQSKGLSRILSNTTVQSINSSALSFLYSPTRTFSTEWFDLLAVQGTPKSLFYRYVHLCHIADSTCKGHHIVSLFIFLTYFTSYDSV